MSAWTSTVIFFFKPAFYEKWGNGDEGAEEDERSGFKRPASFLHCLEEHWAVDAEEEAVDHAWDADSGVISHHAFQIDGAVAEVDEGNRF